MKMVISKKWKVDDSISENRQVKVEIHLIVTYSNGYLHAIQIEMFTNAKNSIVVRISEVKVIQVCCKI